MSKWKPPKSEDQVQQERAQRELLEKLQLIAQYLEESDFHEAIKDYNPTPEQMQEWTMLFRVYQKQKRGL